MNQRMDAAATNIDIALQAFSARNEITLAKQNKRMNSIMLLLTLTTICFMPPQVIGGIMGMNVFVPMSDVEDSLVPFIIILGVMAVFVLIIVFILRYLKVTKGW